jgi:hypothetical protein
MYIGPWQEYKLARILQLKDKVDQEERENNKLDANSAASVSQKGQFNTNYSSNYANSEGFKYNRNNENLQKIESFTSKPRSNSRKSRKSHKAPSIPKKQFRHRSHNQVPSHLPRYPKFKNTFSNASPTASFTNSSSKGANSSASFKQTQGIPSSRTVHHSEKMGYLRTTVGSDARSYGTQLVHEMRQKTFMGQFNKGNINRHIELVYDRWNRFENFVKFASNKEKRDRLKEVEPPPVEHYVDADTVYKIREMGQGRPPRITKKPLVTKGEINKQHKERVNKMKQLYGIGVNEGRINNILQDTELDHHTISINAASQNQVFDYNPEGSDKFDKSSSSLQAKKQTKLEPIEKPTLEANRNEKGVKNSTSLYSFYQNIIDKNNEGGVSQSHKDKLSHPNYQIHSTKQSNDTQSDQKVFKESPSLAQKSSKFKNAGRDIIHNSPHANLGKAEEAKINRAENLEEIIEENIDNSQRESLHETINWPKKENLSPMLHKTIKGSQIDESDGDGLINWALNLPDEMSGSHSSQFFNHS